MLGVVAPVLHRYVTPGLATVEMVAVGWLTVMILLAVAVTVGTAVSLMTVVVTTAVQPLADVIVTE
ncbi:hypothetical protein GCM10027577_41050 [Spirosoma fluminis]